MTTLKKLNDSRITFYKTQEECEQLVNVLNQDNDSEMWFKCLACRGGYCVEVVDVSAEPVLHLGYL